MASDKYAEIMLLGGLRLTDIYLFYFHFLICILLCSPELDVYFLVTSLVQS